MQFGVCRHRALLSKYFCDRMEPPVPRELVRRYLDFSRLAWNVVLLYIYKKKKVIHWSACWLMHAHHHDLRQEMEPEYFCWYILLTRTKDFPSNGCNIDPDCFPVLSTSEKAEKTANASLIMCSVGSVEAAAKVRTIHDHGTSVEEIRNFVYGFLGEIRILGALKQSYIVELYGIKYLLTGFPQQMETLRISHNTVYYFNGVGKRWIFEVQNR
ncbi:hypothetical protein DITRI_Ditri10aG0054700 [Diplodiscus trichospermus]